MAIDCSALLQIPNEVLGKKVKVGEMLLKVVLLSHTDTGQFHTDSPTSPVFVEKCPDLDSGNVEVAALYSGSLHHPDLWSPPAR